MTGGSIFALTAWLTLLGMWGGAGLTDYLMDRTASPVNAPNTTPVQTKAT
jgi:hypothetical protein